MCENEEKIMYVLSSSLHKATMTLGINAPELYSNRYFLQKQCECDMVNVGHLTTQETYLFMHASVESPFRP